MEQTKELKDQIASFFNRKEKEAGKRDFKNHRDNLLEVIKESIHVVKEYPVYGAIAFLGKFRFKSGCPKLKALTKGTSAGLLREIMENKSAQLADSARDAWDHLMAHEPETACVVLTLCYVASSNKTINNRL